MSLQELQDSQDFLYKLCLTPNLSVEEKDNILKLAPESIREHLATQPLERLKVYRRLVQHNISETIHTTFQTLKFILKDSEMQRIINDFFDKGSFTSHHYRHVPAEFYDFLIQDTVIRSHPIYLEASDYDIIKFNLIFEENIRNIPDSLPSENILAGKILLNPSVKIKKFNYPVFNIETFTDISSIDQCETEILFYRTVTDFQIKEIKINPMTKLFLQTLINNKEKSLKENIEEITPTKKEKEIFTESCKELVKGLLEQEMILAIS